MWDYHCLRLICDDCNPYIVERRGKALLKALEDIPQEKVWFGTIPQSQRVAVRKIKARCGASTATMMLHYSDEVGIISTHNLTEIGRAHV